MCYPLFHTPAHPFVVTILTSLYSSSLAQWSVVCHTGSIRFSNGRASMFLSSLPTPPNGIVLVLGIPRHRVMKSSPPTYSDQVGS